MLVYYLGTWIETTLQKTVQIFPMRIWIRRIPMIMTIFSLSSDDLPLWKRFVFFFKKNMFGKTSLNDSNLHWQHRKRREFFFGFLCISQYNLYIDFGYINWMVSLYIFYAILCIHSAFWILDVKKQSAISCEMFCNRILVLKKIL